MTLKCQICCKTLARLCYRSPYLLFLTKQRHHQHVVWHIVFCIILYWRKYLVCTVFWRDTCVLLTVSIYSNSEWHVHIARWALSEMMSSLRPASCCTLKMQQNAENCTLHYSLMISAYTQGVRLAYFCSYC